MELTDISRVLGGRKMLQAEIRSPMDLVELSRRGISRAALNHLIGYAGLTLTQMASLLPITERTIQRYDFNAFFNAAVSEQILAIARLFARGEQVFGAKSKFLDWLHAENPALARKKPFDLLASRFGSDMVNDELGRIEHGLIS